MDKPITLNLLGDIAAGKGTQAKILAEKYNLELIDTGAYSRKMLTGQKKVSKRLERIKLGKLAPSDIIQDFLRKSLQALDESEGVLLDGAKMPDEARLVHEIWNKQNRKTLVLYLSIPEEEIFRRLRFRYYSKETGEPLAISLEEAESEKFQGEVIKRADDDEEAIQNRIEYYDKIYSKTVKFWQEKGLLRKIKGDQPVEKVTEDIVKEIKDYYGLD